MQIEVGGRRAEGLEAPAHRGGARFATFDDRGPSPRSTLSKSGRRSAGAATTIRSKPTSAKASSVQERIGAPE